MKSTSGMKKYMKNGPPNNFKIQITSMVDMFVILLVFLLKSFSTSPVTVIPTKDLHLPQSVSHLDPVDVIKLQVSKSGIYVEEVKVLDLSEGTVNRTDMDPNDSRMIPALFKELDQQAEKMRTIASVNTAVEFDGKILLQADKGLNYELLQKVMYTSMLAGYSEVKLAVAE